MSVPNLVKFKAGGRIFSVGQEILGQHPESYLAWVVESHREAISQGRTIKLNMRPEKAKKLFRPFLNEGGFPPVEQNEAILPNEDPSDQSPFDLAIQTAIDETLDVLRRIRRLSHFHDQVFVIYQWSQVSGNIRILRPFKVKLYESITGRLYDYRRSDETEDAHQLCIDSLSGGTFISPYMQTSIVRCIKEEGYRCSFADVFVDSKGTVIWKEKGRNCPRGMSDGSIKCLMVIL